MFMACLEGIMKMKNNIVYILSSRYSSTTKPIYLRNMNGATTVLCNAKIFQTKKQALKFRNNMGTIYWNVQLVLLKTLFMARLEGI